MIVFVDTNILISASWSQNGTPFLAFAKAVTPPNTAVTCHQNIYELIRVYNRKFTQKLHELEHFLIFAIPLIEIVHVPSTEIEDEAEIRDIDDRSILRAAREVKADILLTGDKDFLESSITSPRIMTAAQFIQMS